MLWTCQFKLVAAFPQDLVPHTCNPQSLKANSSLGFLKLGLGGIRPFSRMSTALINPASPAVHSVWPRFAFTVPTNRV